MYEMAVSLVGNRRMDSGDIELLTPQQAADALQVSLATLRGFVKDGDLVFINKSRGKERPRMAFDPADIWIEGRRFSRTTRRTTEREAKTEANRIEKELKEKLGQQGAADDSLEI